MYAVLDGSSRGGQLPYLGLNVGKRLDMITTPKGQKEIAEMKQ